MAKPQQQKIVGLNTHQLRIDFVPLTDCAPLVVAAELGLYGKYGLDVRLHRELGWATIRDKIIYGELDAAHAVAGMPFAATIGFGTKAHVITAFRMDLNGNGITLSTEIWEKMKKAKPALANDPIERPLKADLLISVTPPPQMPATLAQGTIQGCCVGDPGINRRSSRASAPT